MNIDVLKNCYFIFVLDQCFCNSFLAGVVGLAFCEQSGALSLITYDSGATCAAAVPVVADKSLNRRLRYNHCPLFRTNLQVRLVVPVMFVQRFVKKR